ncbi:MAG: AfsR/SARP family transcriptional regulator, partial [Gaiellaceae bacterium]
MLGPLVALVDDEPVALGPPKQRALLAQLLLNANEAIPVERLIDVLWPEDPPASARHAVQVYVSRLRRVLGAERIAPRAKAYVLLAGPDELDLVCFRRFLADARDALSHGEPGRAAGRVAEALALWQGPGLA